MFTLLPMSAAAPAVVQPGFNYESVKQKKKMLISDEDISCLITATYFENKDDTDIGIKAVAHTIVNRTHDGRFKPTVCQTVKQRVGGHWQFSYQADKRRKISEPEAYRNVSRLVHYIVDNNEPDFTHGAVMFHNRRVHPRWKNTVRIGSFGQHVYYKLRRDI